jgi:hypothetical protein
LEQTSNDIGVTLLYSGDQGMVQSLLPYLSPGQANWDRDEADQQQKGKQGSKLATVYASSVRHSP